MKRLTSLDTPLLPAAVIALCYIVFFVQLLDRRHHDVSLFVIAGGPNVDAARVPPSLTVIPNIGGYDGLTFYRLALDPFSSARTAFGITLDNPSYRNQRIAYPFLVWLVSLGRARWVPWSLVAVNIAGAAGMAAFAGAFAKRAGRHALWGVIVPLYPGFVLTFSRDLAEIVTAMFAMGAIWALAARRSRIAAVLLTCAVLTREPTILLAVALGGAWLIERLLRRPHRIEPITFLVPVTVDFLWQIFLTFRWGISPLRAGAPARAMPFVEFARFFAAAAARRTQEQRLYFLECLFLAIVVMAVIWIWRRTTAPLEWRLAFLGFLALAAILPHTIWMEDYGFLRILADFYLVGTVLILASKSPVRWLILISTAGLWYDIAKYLVREG